MGCNSSYFTKAFNKKYEDSYKDSDILKGIWEVYHSWIDEKISDYNTDFITSQGIILRHAIRKEA